MTGRAINPGVSGRMQAGIGLVLLIALATPWARLGMEASMWRHMLMQFPCWLIVGGLLAGGLGPRSRAALSSWNTHGVAGLTAASIILALLMVPRLLDLALYVPGVELAKLAALLLVGAALRLSWQPAGLILQSFFLGYMVAMMAVVGMLYMDSPVRLCNAYLLDDQASLGRWLVAWASIIGVTWLIHAGRALMRQEEEQLRARQNLLKHAGESPPIRRAH